MNIEGKTRCLTLQDGNGVCGHTWGWRFGQRGGMGGLLESQETGTFKCDCVCELGCLSVSRE